jgi:hypothetical protein
MKSLYTSKAEGDFTAVYVQNDIKSCPIRQLGLLANNTIFKSLGLSANDIKMLVIKPQKLIRHNIEITPQLLLEYIQAYSRHNDSSKSRKLNSDFWYPDEKLDEDDPNNEFWFLRNENFHLLIDDEDSPNYLINIFDPLTTTAINAYAEMYLFWEKRNINICTPNVYQKSAINCDPTEFDTEIAKQQKLLFDFI